MKLILATTMVTMMISTECLAKFSKSSARAAGTRKGNQLGTQISGSAQSGQATADANFNSLQKSSANNLNNGQKGQAVAYMMAGAFAGAALRYYGVCSGSFFTGYAACVTAGIMAGMALASRKSGESFNDPITDSYRNLCEYNPAGCTGTNPPNPYTNTINQTPYAEKDLNSMVKILEGKGFSVDPHSGIVKTPDGKVVDPTKPASVEAAVGAEAAGSLMKELSAAEKAAVAKADQVKPLSLAAMGFEEGGGGGGGTIASVAGFEDGSGTGTGGAGAGFGSAQGGGKGLRKPAQVTGLSKNFNGDPIGVAADSIFHMMSRRYQLKNNQKTFFGPELQ